MVTLHHLDFYSSVLGEGRVSVPHRSKAWGYGCCWWLDQGKICSSCLITWMESSVCFWFDSQGYGCPGLSITANAVATAEIARVDASCSTFVLVHSSLGMLTIGENLLNFLSYLVSCFNKTPYQDSHKLSSSDFSSTLWIRSTEREVFAFFGKIEYCGLLGEYVDLEHNRIP